MTNNFIEQLEPESMDDWLEHLTVKAPFLTTEINTQILINYIKSAKILHQIATDPNLKVVRGTDIKSPFLHDELTDIPNALEDLIGGK